MDPVVSNSMWGKIIFRWGGSCYVLELNEKAPKEPMHDRRLLDFWNGSVNELI